MPVPNATDTSAFHRTHSSSYIVIPGAPEPWFHIPPPRRAVPDVRLRRLARLLHLLGERPLYEWLREVIGGRDPVERLEVYAELDPDILAAIGGDRLPSLRPVQ